MNRRFCRLQHNLGGIIIKMSLYVTTVSVLMTIIGFFSYQTDLNMSGVFSEITAKICSKIQKIFNYTVCLIMVICTIIGCFTDTTFVSIVLFCGLFAVNFIYTVTVLSLCYKVRKRKLVNTMREFLKNNMFVLSDEELVKQFCREYRQINIKEARKAYNSVKKTRDSLSH